MSKEKKLWECQVVLLILRIYYSLNLDPNLIVSWCQHTENTPTTGLNHINQANGADYMLIHVYTYTHTSTCTNTHLLTLRILRISRFSFFYEQTCMGIHIIIRRLMVHVEPNWDLDDRLTSSMQPQCLIWLHNVCHFSMMLCVSHCMVWFPCPVFNVCLAYPGH